MLNLVPQTDSSTVYAEALSRLASVRHALRLVDGGFSAGPEGDRAEGREPHVLACKTMVDEIRRELRDVAGIVLA